METQLHAGFRCPKKREELISQNSGLYCTECSKPILDFSMLNTKQIIEQLEQSQEKPCIIIREETLSNYVPPATVVLKKSAFLLFLLLLLGNIKTLFAQTKIDQAEPADGPSIPTGYQKIILSGYVKDASQKPIYARVNINFNKATIATAQTDEHGYFSCSIENYGGIKQLDIEIISHGYDTQTIKDYQILKEKPVLSITLLEEQKAILADGMMISTYYSGSSYPVVYYLQRVDYKTKVLDIDNNPIPNARVEIKFPKNETRWGMTDNEGNLTMHMDLSEPALRGNIYVTADGYKPKKVMFYDFLSTGIINHQLKKVKVVESPPTVTTVDTHPISIPTKQDAELENNPEHVLLFPNPANETATIKFNHSLTAKIILSNSHGQIMFRKSIFQQSEAILEVGQLMNGHYVITIQYENKTFTEKLIVIH